MRMEFAMPSSATRKRPLNVSVRSDLVKEAKAFKTNVSAVLERALEEEHRKKRNQLWREQNRAAIQAWNDWIEENGVPFSDLRPW
jgi:antitoxin CcdA